jgi:hypothetical protein
VFEDAVAEVADGLAWRDSVYFGVAGVFVGREVVPQPQVEVGEGLDREAGRQVTVVSLMEKHVLRIARAGLEPVVEGGPDISGAVMK